MDELSGWYHIYDKNQLCQVLDIICVWMSKGTKFAIKQGQIKVSFRKTYESGYLDGSRQEYTSDQEQVVTGFGFQDVKRASGERRRTSPTALQLHFEPGPPGFPLLEPGKIDIAKLDSSCSSSCETTLTSSGGKDLPAESGTSPFVEIMRSLETVNLRLQNFLRGDPVTEMSSLDGPRSLQDGEVPATVMADYPEEETLLDEAAPEDVATPIVTPFDTVIADKGEAPANLQPIPSDATEDAFRLEPSGGQLGDVLSGPEMKSPSGSAALRHTTRPDETAESSAKEAMTQEYETAEMPSDGLHESGEPDSGVKADVNELTLSQSSPEEGATPMTVLDVPTDVVSPNAKWLKPITETTESKDQPRADTKSPDDSKMGASTESGTMQSPIADSETKVLYPDDVSDGSSNVEVVISDSGRQEEELLHESLSLPGTTADSRLAGAGMDRVVAPWQVNYPPISKSFEESVSTDTKYEEKSTQTDVELSEDQDQDLSPASLRDTSELRLRQDTGVQCCVLESPRVQQLSPERSPPVSLSESSSSPDSTMEGEGDFGERKVDSAHSISESLDYGLDQRKKLRYSPREEPSATSRTNFSLRERSLQEEKYSESASRMETSLPLHGYESFYERLAEAKPSIFDSPPEDSFFKRASDPITFHREESFGFKSYARVPLSSTPLFKGLSPSKEEKDGIDAWGFPDLLERSAGKNETSGIQPDAIKESSPQSSGSERSSYEEKLFSRLRHLSLTDSSPHPSSGSSSESAGQSVSPDEVSHRTRSRVFAKDPESERIAKILQGSLTFFENDSDSSDDDP